MPASLIPSGEGTAFPVGHGRSVVLQWHITERCNLRCTHCYQDQSCIHELSFEQLLLIVDQFRSFLRKRQAENPGIKTRGLVNITGGEPILREDFFDLLERLAENQDYFSFGILTNGTLIDATAARRLAALKPHYVQVSLEGSQQTNDAIRGSGTYAQIIAALQHLKAQGIKTAISFTAHRANYREFIDVARIARSLGVTRVWADRLIPCGMGVSLGEQQLTPEETRELFQIMYAADCEFQRSFCDTEVFMGRALQFLIGGGEPYRCAAGNSLVALQANGDLYPCRRMPIRVGNVLESSLIDLYEHSELFRKLRHHETSSGCESCAFRTKCRGGLKCLAYAVYGSPFVADPGCWRAGNRSSIT